MLRTDPIRFLAIVTTRTMTTSPKHDTMKPCSSGWRVDDVRCAEACEQTSADECSHKEERMRSHKEERMKRAGAL